MYVYPLSYGFPCYLQGGLAYQSAWARLSYAGRYMGTCVMLTQLYVCIQRNAHGHCTHTFAGAMRAIGSDTANYTKTQFERTIPHSETSHSCHHVWKVGIAELSVCMYVCMYVFIIAQQCCAVG